VAGRRLTKIDAASPAMPLWLTVEDQRRRVTDLGRGTVFTRYHVTARGNERKPIYREDCDRAHFLELLAEATERFGTRIHAYVLMDNHYDLLVETPEANLSRAMQG
jgi:hypothetical protein